MEDKGAWNQLTKAAGELRDSSRDRAVDTRSALAGGLVGLLVSTRGGRSLIGKTLKYGIVAGLGALAWQSRQRDQEAAHRRIGSNDSLTTSDSTRSAVEDPIKRPPGSEI
ncbi:DUF533 domain-containing protein [Halomonas sp. PR-M31]|uniref:DUF533 domain-containing protein n=1 Tax=Halomonas sp. PR-M31 TaxID=1471202 RepID=UPI00069FE3D2|nr:DUF533 domain-containing protein [Halomonas sp. PR-M31]